MPNFVTIGYGDLGGYDRTAPDVRNAAHARHEELKMGRWPALYPALLRTAPWRFGLRGKRRVVQFGTFIQQNSTREGISCLAYLPRHPSGIPALRMLSQTRSR